jgi:uncharacterized 2Fe-2S/4Fe-4S cluster protein (DUF4445 family)
MSLLNVIQEDDERFIPFNPRATVREILEDGDMSLFTACGGSGVCGRCLVRIHQGVVSDPTAKERNYLSADRIQQGLRLACQVRVDGNARITVENPAPKPNWRGLAQNGATSIINPAAPVSVRTGLPQAYGVALDLGTTQLRITAWDLNRGQRMAGRIGLNPQVRFGADVLIRLMGATESDKRAGEMSRLVKNAVKEVLRDIFGGEGRIQEITHMVIVGNTAMLALLTEANVGRLLRPDSWMREFECKPGNKTAWNLTWGLDPRASINVVQPLAGFVGSDLMAGVLATGLTRKPAGALLIDFGTNSEMALWDGERIWVTSAAGGPAFEGGMIRCGMPAEPGAIYKIIPEASSPGFRCQVIGGGPPKGICGSGLVDIMAYLLEAGLLKGNGRFSPGVGEEGFVLSNGGKVLS